MQELSWVGSKQDFVDVINVQKISHVTVGRFGGNSSAGQYKNEDGCLVWVVEEWEFTVLLDAHQTAESAELIISTIHLLKPNIQMLLKLSVAKAFPQIGDLLISTFASTTFRDACQKIQGETAFLCVIRKDKYIWWLSIGDCVLHLFHPELNRLHEYQQNHRSFFEWIGRKNTFDLEVPCYSTGTKELRKGNNQLFLTTDGLIECPDTPYANPAEIQKIFMERDIPRGIEFLLEQIKAKNVRDSTTIISWAVHMEKDVTLPSDYVIDK